MQGTKDRNKALEEAMTDVKPLENRDKLKAPPKTLRRRKRRVSSGAEDDICFEIERLGEKVEGIAPGIDRALLRRLRSGEIRRDARIDLHGCDVVGARRKVHEAIRQLREKDGRCLLVIHGRGRNSEDGPVLKDRLFEWLAEAPVGPQVMAFCSATGGDGGVGATYVLLRRER